MMGLSRRTRIVATLGPATQSPEMIARLMDAGVNIFRLNFSHGVQSMHGEAVRNIRAAQAERQCAIGILQDLQGPKIRVGELAGHQPVELLSGRSIRITTRAVVGHADLISTTYQALPDDVRRGDSILLDDGRLVLKAMDVCDDEVTCEIVVGGWLKEHKGINLPQTPLSAPCLTGKDLDDLRFGLSAGVDFVGLSFVRQPSDIDALRREAHAMGHDPFVIAKIERVEAIANLEAIVAAADGVMVARGDLGVETSAADVPLLQKRILQVTCRHGKPDITATQMLESMIENPQPTRAEATDVANAVFDGTDAVMLSGETAVGRYPVEAVRAMAAIAAKAEDHLAEFRQPVPAGVETDITVAEATVHAACAAAREVKAAAICVFTLSGRTAFLTAAMRPGMPILAFTPHERTYNRLAFAWGVQPFKTRMIENPAEMSETFDKVVGERGDLAPGSRVVLLAGNAPDAGTTNIMRIHQVESA